MPAEPADKIATSLTWAIWLLAGEAAVLAAVLVFLVYGQLTAAPDSPAGAAGVMLYAASMAALFALLSISLRRRRAWARGPAIVLQLLLVPIGYYMVAGGLTWLGIPVIVVGLCGAGTLLAPATRAALGVR